MKVSYARANEILKTLPIGYYVGRKINTKLEENSTTSYFDILNDEIFISLSNINKMIEKVDSISDEDLEKFVRDILYHEVSHAILTPKTLKVNNPLNIVEDKRIETLLERYYIGVDFKEMRNYMKDEVNEDDDNLSKFYQFVFHNEFGNEDLRKIFNKIMNTYKNMKSNSSENISRNYTSAVNALYKAFCEYEDSKNKDEEKNHQNDSDNTSGTGSNESFSAIDSFKDKIDSDNSLRNYDKESIKDMVENSYVSSVELNYEDDGFKNEKDTDNWSGGKGQSYLEKYTGDLMRHANQFVNKDLIDNLTRIFSQSSKVKKSNSSAINSYSGVFDPRSAARNDYKYFVQKNRSGNIKAFSKIHLNLFLDRSGSFSSNEEIANQILYALNKIEKNYSDFDYTLITCGVGEQIENKKNYVYEAEGGTQISNKIFDTYKKVQKSNCVNYNIVLYDGRCYNYYTDQGSNGYIGNFGAFNHENTLVITDPENQDATRYVPSARVVVTKNYTDTLIDNLIKMLEKLVRI